MAEDKFKRNIAYKFRIGDLLIGKPVMDGERFNFLELGNKRIVRVNVVGNVVDKHDVDDEKRYSFVTIDDGSGQIQLRAFSEDAEKLKNLNQGETVLIIGVLRIFNNEIYISPEIVRLQDPSYLLIRKLEIEKNRSSLETEKNTEEDKEKATAIKDKILGDIKNSEEDNGIYVDELIMKHREISAEIINQEIKKLLEEGIIFEPRPGKVRWLG